MKFRLFKRRSEAEHIMRALAYHAAITTALTGHYDQGGFSITERADAFYDLFRAYCDGETANDEEEALAAMPQPSFRGF